MSRSKWKGPYINYLLLNKVLNKKNKKIILTKSRSSVIVPNCVGITFKMSKYTYCTQLS